METQTKTSAKDFFLHIGSMVALYAMAVNLVNMLFTVINKAYPQINSGYNYYYNSSHSISFPVATLVIMFPVFIILMWLLEKSYIANPEKKTLGLKKWLTYITLFISGAVVVGDLITLLYYFLDGQELTTGFILKILVVLAVALGIFMYFITDIRDKLTHTSRVVWRIVALVIVVGSIVLGFSIIGSPFNQRLYKYDEQKVSDLQNLQSQVENYYSNKKVLPKTIEEMGSQNYYISPVDQQTGKAYEYRKVSDTEYELCAEFNKETISPYNTQPALYGWESWAHPSGKHCFKKTIHPENYNYGAYPLPAPIK